MAELLKYKDYHGSAEVDFARGVCKGKILFISDLVTYETKDPAKLQSEFEAAVDDYLETCTALKRQPQKAFTGQFNVRIDPADHHQLAVVAATDGVPLNSIMNAAVKQFLSMKTGKATIEHVHRMQFEEVSSKVVTSISQPKQWEALHATVH